MKKDINPKEWSVEFEKFLSAPESNPPQEVTKKIFSKIHQDLNPASSLVFVKMLLIHLVVGSLTLFFCPQFGFSFFSNLGLMGILMRFGPLICHLGCGAVFLGSSTFVSSMLLRPEEIKIMRKTKFRQLILLSLLSFGAFLLLGLTALTTLALAWILGSILGGLTTLEFGWELRSYFRKKIIFGT